MKFSSVKPTKWLLPLSCLYGWGVMLRNALFDMGFLKKERFDIPIISVGNLTVGGTGKTPHIEYLVQLLSERYKVAVLSRGYKRQSTGYIIASTDTPIHKIGDEAWQIKQKFPHIYVAVDKKRTRGIKRLMTDSKTKDVQVILLDDAFQHRYVDPSLSILLVDYNRLPTNDRLLPAGYLREPKENAVRANIIIVTKCPSDIKPLAFRVTKKELNPRPFQRIFFSSMRYNRLYALFSTHQIPITQLPKEVHTLLLTGIATPQQIRMDLEKYVAHIHPISFPDHHYFTQADIANINASFAALPPPRLAITTEKDAARLRAIEELSSDLKEALYVLPTQIEILRDEGYSFNDKILGHVLKNSRNRQLAQSAVENMPHNSNSSGHRLR